MSAQTFPLMALARHRMATDGQGVTTLAAAHGCPLRCALCLNPICQRADTQVRRVNAQELYDLVKADDLYFQATGGGVTFGGGEPLVHAEFIARFCALCAPRWRITAETCLNIPEDCLRTAIRCVDAFLVDIKDMNPEIYRRYTGADNAPVARNLRILLDGVGPERVVARVPHIPGYNAPRDVEASVQALRTLGVRHLDVFTYRVQAKALSNRP